MEQAKPQKTKQTGLLEAVLILDILLPILVWLTILSIGTDNPGSGMLISLLVVPLWLLFCVPVVAIAAYGIKSSKRMATPAMQKVRLAISITAITERAVIAGTLLYFILV